MNITMYTTKHGTTIRVAMYSWHTEIQDADGMPYFGNVVDVKVANNVLSFKADNQSITVQLKNQRPMLLLSI